MKPLTFGVGVRGYVQQAQALCDLALDADAAFSDMDRTAKRQPIKKWEKLHDLLRETTMHLGRRRLIAGEENGCDGEILALVSEMWPIVDTVYERDSCKLIATTGSIVLTLDTFRWHDAPHEGFDAFFQFGSHYAEKESAVETILRGIVASECFGRDYPVRLLRPTLVVDERGERYEGEPTWQPAVPAELAVVIALYERFRGRQFESVERNAYHEGPLEHRSRRDWWINDHKVLPLIAGVRV